MVFPGGGYQILAIDLEGTEVCDWLTSRGITCVLLKYRVPKVGPSWNQPCGCDRKTGASMPLEDAQRTVGLVRFHAAEWHIDPRKIGVLGFSAGGHLVAAVSTHCDARVYPAVDAADRESCRPDFAVALSDNVDDMRNSLVYYIALKNAGVPAELHLYAEGGHAFGLRRTERPITAWPRLVETWLKTIGMISD
ncbi:MAG TPA: alpha/beta hydrolase [Gemmatimonadales bacterium]